MYPDVLTTSHSYLQILFPLILCGISLLFLLVHVFQQAIRARRKEGYNPLGSDANVFGVPGHLEEYHDEEEEGGDEIETENADASLEEQYLALRPTLSATHDPVLKVDRPRGEVQLVVIEELAVIGVFAINLTALLTSAWGKHGTLAAISGLIAWGYVLVLASCRLLLSSSGRYSFPKLWNHTAAIYCVNFFFLLLLFRSVLVHPRSKLEQILRITEFALVSLLGGIALTTRKGNKTVVLETEEGIEPSLEPLASIFSLATFTWVDSIVAKGYRKTTELKDVWNLIPKDRAATSLSSFRQLR
jgi:hypothetical protein